MGNYSLDLDGLSKYTGTPIEVLKKEPYIDLENLIKAMNENKFINQCNQTAADAEFGRLVCKYFQPFGFLRHWFDEKEIILACANSGLQVYDLCMEEYVEPGRKHWNKNAEYLRTSVESMPQYDAKGREFMERSQKRMDVYRVANKYQSTKQGEVIKLLVYGRYPELEKFGFKFYGMDCSNYEIYPENNIYVDFVAMMSGNVDAILFRNEEYCKWYNKDRYSPEGHKKAISTWEAREMFDLIRRIGENEKALGHSIIGIDDKGADYMLNKMKPAAGAGSMRLFMEDRERLQQGTYARFGLEYPEGMTLYTLAKAFLEMKISMEVEITVAHKEDYLCEHAFTVRINGEPGHCYAAMNPAAPDRSLCPVTNTFGYIKSGKTHLIIRIDCPELMK